MRAVLFATLFVSACSEPAPGPPSAPAPEPTAPVEPSPPPVDPLPSATEVVPPEEPSLPAPPAPSDEDLAVLAAGSRSLGASLFRVLGRPAAESFAIAPASILAAVGMTAAGARGETRGEMLATLGIAPLGDRAPAALGGLLGTLGGDELAIANRIYAASDLPIEPAFVDLTRDLFRAPIERVTFGEPARIAINGWVDERTAHRIPEILPPESIDASTVMVLVNAMYFLAAWRDAFDPARTTDAFFAAPAGRVSCRMMQRTGRVAIALDPSASVLTLPYAGDRFAATFVLPPEGTTLDAFEASLDGERLGALLALPTERADVRVEIPRFRVEAAQPTSLHDALVSMGMVRAFGDADFGGIAPPDPRPIVLSDVFHRVFVETTERGTEAAAATAVVAVRGGRPAVPEPMVFRADRPFLFVVTERASGLVLFLARVATPGTPE